MRYLVVILSLAIFFSCSNHKQEDINKFKTGTFKTHLDDSDATSVAHRNESIQIETYNNVKDTFSIKWTSNFEYELVKTKPKTQLDSTPFLVKITGIKDNSYTFLAHYKGSNFKQRGSAVKIETDSLKKIESN